MRFIHVILVFCIIYSSNILYSQVDLPYPYKEVENIYKEESLQGKIQSVKKLEYYKSSGSKFTVDSNNSFEITLDRGDSISKYTVLRDDSMQIFQNFYYKSNFLNLYDYHGNNFIETSNVFRNALGQVQRDCYKKCVKLSNKK